MSEPIRVAILGFSAFERSALASYFMLAAKRTPCYAIVLDIDEAHFVIADADQPGVAELLRELGRTSDAVFVGAGGPADAAACMARPFDPMLVMRELDTQLAGRYKPPPEPAPVPLPPPSPPLTAVGRPVAAPPARASPAQIADAPAEPAQPSVEARRELALAQKRLREAALRPVPLRRALLVDDSEIALHFLDRLLAPYGLDTDYAHESDRALELLSHQRYGFVFLDVDLGEASPLDGLALCHRIKHEALTPGGRAPLVIIVSAFHDPVDQVRGTLAGADAYLGKPLDPEALDKLLQRQGLNREATAPQPASAADPSKPR